MTTLPLFPQQAEWLTVQKGDENFFFTPSPFVVKLPRCKEPPQTQATLIEHLFSRYDALTARLTMGQNGHWGQSFSPDRSPKCAVVLLANSDFPGFGWVPGTVDALRKSINIHHGNLAATALVVDPAGDRYFVCIIHHLALDATSWRHILSDFVRLLATSDATAYEPRPSALKAALAINGLADAPSVIGEFQHWDKLDFDLGTSLPYDFAGADNVASSIRSLNLSLGGGESRGLFAHARNKNITVGELIAGMVAAGSVEFFGMKRVIVDSYINGRDVRGMPDLGETVGWLSTNVPLELEAKDGQRALDVVAEQVNSRFLRGFGFSLLKHSTTKDSLRMALRGRPRPRIACNFIGVVDSRTIAAAEIVDRHGAFCRVDPQSTPQWPLFFHCSVIDRRLEIELNFSGLYAEGTARSLLNIVEKKLLGVALM